MDQDQVDALWRLEEQFWLGTAGFYAANLAPDALMVLPPPAGILDREATLAAIDQAPRWRSVSLDHRHLVSVGAATAVLAYLAHAQRDTAGNPYAAQCSSTYVHDQGQWLLLMHHQTPVDAAGGGRG